jgi:hypothetical protein
LKSRVEFRRIEIPDTLKSVNRELQLTNDGRKRAGKSGEEEW